MRSEPRARLGLAIAVLIAAFGACTRPTPPPAPRSDVTDAPAPSVVLPDGFAVHVEIAADDATRQQGLMYRNNLREGSGMLFVFPQSGEYAFWMKDTLIPLDMVWIDDQKRIVAVKHDVPPCKADPCPSYSPNATARYVLEIGAGVAARHQAEVGRIVTVERLENVIVR